MKGTDISRQFYSSIIFPKPLKSSERSTQLCCLENSSGTGEVTVHRLSRKSITRNISKVHAFPWSQLGTLLKYITLLQCDIINHV